MPESSVESAAAEQAKADIRLLYDDYRVAKTARKQRRGRIRLDDFADRQDQLLVVSVVGVAWGEFAKREPQRNAAAFAQMFEWMKAGKLNNVAPGEPVVGEADLMSFMQGRAA